MMRKNKNRTALARRPSHASARRCVGRAEPSRSGGCSRSGAAGDDRSVRVELRMSTLQDDIFTVRSKLDGWAEHQETFVTSCGFWVATQQIRPMVGSIQEIVLRAKPLVDGVGIPLPIELSSTADRQRALREAHKSSSKRKSLQLKSLQQTE